MAEQGIVANLRVRIQGQMGTVKRDVIIKEQAEQFVTLAGPRMSGSPKESMMRDDEIRFRCDGHLHRRERGIDNSGDARNTSRILDLKTILRAGPICE